MTYDSIDKFMESLTREDLDMVDKVGNLYEAGVISSTAYGILMDYDAPFRTAEDNVIMDLRAHPEQFRSHIRDAEEFIVRELGDEFVGDYAAAIYDCDDIYLEAINKAVEPYMIALEQTAEVQSKQGAAASDRQAK